VENQTTGGVGDKSDGRRFSSACDIGSKAAKHSAETHRPWVAREKAARLRAVAQAAHRKRAFIFKRRQRRRFKLAGWNSLVALNPARDGSRPWSFVLAR
jgi:hypothetical protein